MEWFVWLAPVPATAVPAVSAADVLQFPTAARLVSLIGLVVACTPILLALRDRLRGPTVTAELPRLQVLEGGKEPRRRAA